MSSLLENFVTSKASFSVGNEMCLEFSTASLHHTESAGLMSTVLITKYMSDASTVIVVRLVWFRRAWQGVLRRICLKILFDA